MVNGRWLAEHRLTCFLGNGDWWWSERAWHVGASEATRPRTRWDMERRRRSLLVVSRLGTHIQAIVHMIHESYRPVVGGTVPCADVSFELRAGPCYDIIGAALFEPKHVSLTGNGLLKLTNYTNIYISIGCVFFSPILNKMLGFYIPGRASLSIMFLQLGCWGGCKAPQSSSKVRRSSFLGVTTPTIS